MKLDAYNAKEERRDAEWKETLRQIRAGLPAEHNSFVQGRDSERELLLALCERQEWKCFWCGMQMTNTDRKAASFRSLEHVVARNTGLQIVNHLTNLRAACSFCNHLRGAMQSVVSDRVRAEHLTVIIAGLQAKLARHRVTMSGKCLYCKLRFYFKEWLYRRRY